MGTQPDVITRWGDMTNYRLMGITQPGYLRILADTSRFLKSLLLYTSGWSNMEYSFYTSHGIDHSLRVAENIWKLKQKYGWDILTEKDLLLLYLGAWFHDTGMIFGRENHGEKSQEIINHYYYKRVEHLWREEGIARDDITILKKICAWHSLEIEKFKNEVIHHLRDSKKLDLLACILRFADTLDVAPQRADIPLEVIWQYLPDESKKHWLFHWIVITVDLGSVRDPYIKIVINKEEINRYPDQSANVSERIKEVKEDIGNEINVMRNIFGLYNLRFPEGVQILDLSDYY